MLMTTTPIIEGKRIVKYYGIVSGETIIGANVFRDLFASIRDIVGGRSGSYEEVLRMAKDTALKVEETRTMIFYESPYRLVKTLTQFAEIFGPERQVSVCRDSSPCRRDGRAGE